MNCVIWNVRGINKPFKQKEVSLFHKKSKLSVAGLLETRVKEVKANKIVPKVARGWSWVSNYQVAQNGHIWALWREELVDLQVLQIHEQFIHCKITDRRSDFDTLITFVYGKNNIEDRKSLWTALASLQSGINEPWCLYRDFNAVMDYSNRIDGSNVTNAEIKDFTDFFESKQCF